MKFRLHKRYLPRGLYGRAALILIVPVIVVLIVFSVAFIQRHFEAVSEQLTLGMGLELGLVLETVAGSPDRATAEARIAPLARALEIDLRFADPGRPGGEDRRDLFDISGITVISEMRQNISGIRHIDLALPGERAEIVMTTPLGDLVAEFSRRRVATKNPQRLLLPVVIASVLMTLVTFVFMRNQLRPIRRLAKAADAFGKGQSVPYRPTGAIEVRAAGNAFLAMRARIERQIEQRTLMLSGVSHDLRTPLTRIRLELSMLEPGPEIEAIARDLREMEAMLDAFLDFARSDTLEELAPTDPVALARSVAEDAHRAGQDVIFHATGEGAGAVELPLRRLALRRALANLLSNARRYGGRCRLGVEIGPANVRFIVEDDGPGIPPGRREEALRPFTRLEEARNQDRGGGVGLGLAIAMDIARSHGGTLRLGQSDDLGGLKAEMILAR